ncbi:MAG: UDPGP type 1 family protein [Planctomycetes bacterium]|nr:UDPGP type 1 family protein [Planctomycetota bacterium]
MTQDASTPPDKQALIEQLAATGQQHVLAFWDELSSDQQSALAADVAAIDLAQINRLFCEPAGDHDWTALAGRAEPPPAFRLSGSGDPFSLEEANERGRAALADGRIGVVLVAGGQGTRLGFDHPKGMFPIGPVSGASIFQIVIEGVVAVARSYGKSVPLYLMTSHATHEATIAYLDDHDRFGLPKQDLPVFQQGTMPAVDAETGKLLLAEKGRLFVGPDGHGGMLAALDRSGALADVEARGIRQLFYLQIDNPLTCVCDEALIGYHLLSGSQLSTQVVAKQHPADRVGNVVSIDGQVQIIEYSDLPDTAALQTDDGGSLRLWAGNTAVHVFDVDFLRRMAGEASGLPFHLAHKKVPFIDPSGKFIQPKSPNAIKFERFIFDLLPSARRAIAMEIDRQKAYAPVKNAPGSADSTPATAQAQMVALHSEWLRAAGVEVDDGVAVEISPLYARHADEVPGHIAAGTRITEATYLRLSSQ